MKKSLQVLFFSFLILFTFNIISPPEALAGAVPASTMSVARATEASSAANCKAPDDIGELFDYAICILGGYVVPFLIALALVMFLVGVLKYVKNGDNEEAREAGRGLMLFGIIALFVMIAVWGLVKIIFLSIFPEDKYHLPNLPPQATSPFQQR